MLFLLCDNGLPGQKTTGHSSHKFIYEDDTLFWNTYWADIFIMRVHDAYVCIHIRRHENKNNILTTMKSDPLSLIPMYRVRLRTLYWPGSENNDRASPVRKMKSVQNILYVFAVRKWEVCSCRRIAILNILVACPREQSFNKLSITSYALWIKPTDALNSNFIGITTLHVSGPGSKRSSNCIKCTNADVRLRTPDDGQKGCPKHVDS
jgi:hypothetical protein